MQLYQLKTNQLNIINEQPFKLEKEIQLVFESNLKLLTGLQLVKTEFTIKNKRIDTLAYDEQNKAFIIIEYKRDKNNSVFDQGVTYLNLMLENKADFIVEYNESLKSNLKRNDVDWSQSRVVFVSSSFNENQRQAVNFKDFGIELWEIKRFDNELIYINPIKKSTSAPSIKEISGKNEQLENVEKEIKEYLEEDHLAGKPEEIKELYETFRNAILNITDGIEVQVKKVYIAFKKGKNIADMEIQKSGLKIWINLKKGELDDPKKITNDTSLKGHLGNGDYELKVNDDSQLEYIMSLVKQAIRN